jgi:Tol biopolymer transport system component
MNGTDRVERELTTWFADTAAPQTPEWTADLLAATATIRQRPRWSFPTRWLPAPVVPRLPRLTLRPVPWRTIALLALLGLLLAAAVTLYVGSRPRLPAPFGPAANGLVAYAELGELWTVDPVTGERTKIVTLTGGNVAPRWSRDGTRLAFLRRAEGGQSLAITNVDGSGLVVSDRPAFVEADTDSIAWSPDGRFVAVVANRGAPRTTYLVDTTTGGVRDLETPNVDVEVYWRPPDGRQLMYVRQTGGDNRHLVLVDIEATDGHQLPLLRPEAGLRPGGWTPDGKRFVVHHFDDEDGPWTSLLDPETGDVVSIDIAFGRLSNDGNRIVGFREFLTRQSLCVMAMSGGPCQEIAAGDTSPDPDHTAGLQWSPDDRWIVVYPQDDRGWVLLNPEGGPPITPVWSKRGIESWQRQAP